MMTMVMPDMEKYRDAYDTEYARMQALGHGDPFCSIAAERFARKYLIVTQVSR